MSYYLHHSPDPHTHTQQHILELELEVHMKVRNHGGSNGSRGAALADPRAPYTAPVDTDMAIKFLRCVQTAVLQCCTVCRRCLNVLLHCEN